MPKVRFPSCGLPFSNIELVRLLLAAKLLPAGEARRLIEQRSKVKEEKVSVPTALCHPVRGYIIREVKGSLAGSI
jgi:hypothetical protein